MYIVTVYVYYPYKREREYRIKGSNFAVAINRAIKLFRREPEIKGKKFKELTAKAVKV
jgi:hypothetical protein